MRYRKWLEPPAGCGQCRTEADSTSWEAASDLLPMPSPPVQAGRQCPARDVQDGWQPRLPSCYGCPDAARGERCNAWDEMGLSNVRPSKQSNCFYFSDKRVPAALG